MMDDKFKSGLWKVIAGLIAIVGGILLTIRGCGEIRESMTDESGEVITDEDGQPLELIR